MQSWWTFRICFIFVLLGGGGRGVRSAFLARVGLSLKIPGGGGGGGVLPKEGGWARGLGAVCVEFEGGGPKLFFSGPKFPPNICLHPLWFVN